jgi:type IV fimbrial biogenesis protein FimT
MKKLSGFTLLELLIVVGMVGLLMAFGIPAMSTFAKNDRLSTQINTLVGHLAYARSEAVTRSQQVGLCASSNLTTCFGTDWAAGWIMFVDANGSLSHDNTEEILRVKQALSGNNTLTSTIGSIFIYDSSGFSATGTGTFSLCDDRGVTNMKSISISNTGRVRQGGGAAC